MEAEAVALKSNRFGFHSDQGCPTEGEFQTWEEFHSWDFILNVTEVKVLLNASSFPDYL